MPSKSLNETPAERRGRYRKNAADVRQMAQHAPSAETRAAFLKIAEFWDELAHEEERVP
jgi:hypothetical protein